MKRIPLFSFLLACIAFSVSSNAQNRRNEIWVQLGAEYNGNDMAALNRVLDTSGYPAFKKSSFIPQYGFAFAQGRFIYGMNGGNISSTAKGDTSLVKTRSERVGFYLGYNLLNNENPWMAWPQLGVSFIEQVYSFKNTAKAKSFGNYLTDASGSDYKHFVHDRTYLELGLNGGYKGKIFGVRAYAAYFQPLGSGSYYDIVDQELPDDPEIKTNFAGGLTVFMAVAGRQRSRVRE